MEGASAPPYGPNRTIGKPGNNHARDQILKTKQVYALLYTFNNNENNKQEGKDTRMARLKRLRENTNVTLDGRKRKE